MLTEVLRGAEAERDRTASTVCWAASFAGGIYQEQGSFATSKEIRERALQLAVRYSMREHEARLQTSVGWMDFLGGDWAAARERIEQAFAIAREIGPSALDLALHHNLAALLLAEGSDAQAAPHLAACERGPAAVNLPALVPHFHVPRLLAERDLLAGQPEQARSRLAHALDGLAPDAVEAMPVLHLLAWALHDLGQVDAAAAAAARAAGMARNLGATLLLVDTLRVAALIAVRQRRWEAGKTALQEGLSLARTMGYPYGEARLLHVAGELYGRMGQPDQARERLESVLVIARRLGARRVEQQNQYRISTLS